MIEIASGSIDTIATIISGRIVNIEDVPDIVSF